MLSYLDPASGSVIASAVVAGAAGASVAAKSLMGRFRRSRPADGPADVDAESSATGVEQDEA